MEEKNLTQKKEKTYSAFLSALGNLYNKVSQPNNSEVDENQQLIESVMQAYEEWQSAENFFHSVSDPDLIDHAIYKLEASKARYIYLLKQAKANGIKVNFH